MLRVDEVTRADQLARYRDAWLDLDARAPETDLFNTYDWLTSWLETFWTGKPIAFQFVWRGDKLAGLVPLLAPPTADALTIGAPTNATARTGNEDESAIAVNPNDNQQIAVMTNGIAGDNGLPLSISQDGGQTWTRTVFATGTSAHGR